MQNSRVFVFQDSVHLELSKEQQFFLFGLGISIPIVDFPSMTSTTQRFLQLTSAKSLSNI